MMAEDERIAEVVAAKLLFSPGDHFHWSALLRLSDAQLLDELRTDACLVPWYRRLVLLACQARGIGKWKLTP